MTNANGEDDTEPRNGLYQGVDGKAWYKDDKLHREDGPAVEWSDGATQWYLNGELHRLDGPALDGGPVESFGTPEWYYHGKFIPAHSQEEFERLLKLMLLWE